MTEIQDKKTYVPPTVILLDEMIPESGSVNVPEGDNGLLS